MKTLRIILATFALTFAIIATASCASKEATAEENQVIKVQRGNLTMDIVSGGNLALSKKEDLAFDVAGTVNEVLATEGETVKEGQVLARLDTTTLEEAVKTAERTVKTAEIDLRDAEAGEFRVKSAEFDLETATNNFNKLNYPYAYSTFTLEIPAAIESIKTAQQQMAEALPGLKTGPGSEDYGTAMDKFTRAQMNLVKALEKLSRGQSIDVFSSENISKTVTDYIAARTALLGMERAQYNLEQVKSNVQTAIDKANLALERAKDDLKKAKDNLAKAVITAPFAGFITKVNVAGGDEILKGTVAVQLADPARFEAKIMVGERDIFQVKEGGTATIQIDASPLVILPARVAHISPTATIQSGVVNYEVRIEAESTQSEANPEKERQIPSQWGQSRLPQPSDAPGSQRDPVSQISQLREGLSVTVSIILAEKKNVLLVPNQAIGRSGRDIQVRVMKNGVPEMRTIKTGISNWQYTEVTEGLSEGEEVTIPKTTATSSSSNQGQVRPFMIPGVRGPR